MKTLCLVNSAFFLVFTMTSFGQQQPKNLPLRVQGDFPNTSLLYYVSKMKTGIPVTVEKADMKRQLVRKCVRWQNTVFSNKLSNVLSSKFMESPCPYLFFKHTGPKKDDVSLLEFSGQGKKITVLDGRILALAIEDPALKTKKLSEIVAYNLKMPNQSEPDNPILKVRTVKKTKGYSFGTITVSEKAPITLTRSIEWYRSDKAIVFCFQKVRTPPPSKIPTRDLSTFIGGGLVSEKTPFLLFKNPNAEEHAKILFNAAPEFKGLRETK